MSNHEAPHTTIPTSRPSRILRRPAVLDRLGVSGPTLWRMIRAGRFPPSIQISVGAVGWLESDVDAWLGARAAAAGRPATTEDRVIAVGVRPA